MCLSTIRFIAHLSNQQVCGTVLPLEVILLLLDKPTDDSVEIAVEFMKEAGQILTDLQPKIVNSMFTSLLLFSSLFTDDIIRRVW